MMEISETIFGELVSFGKAALLGGLMAAGYDVIRLFRRLVAHGIAVISVEDIAYWIVSGTAVFLLLYRETDGCIRGYIFGGLLLGALVYYAVFGRWLVKCLGNLIFRAKKHLKKTGRTITISVRRRFNKRSRG